MALGRFMLVLHSHMPYVLSHGKSPHGTDWIFESAAECYLPILDALDRLKNAGIHPRWTINLTPILAEQLDDPSFKSGFEEYCLEKIEAAQNDRKLFEDQGELWMMGLAAMWERTFRHALTTFRYQWQRSICGGFRSFEEAGLIELITCGATHGYFPLLATDESVQGQVKLAVDSHERRFGKKPKGIWMPECAYRPSYHWKSPVLDGEGMDRKGVDEFLKENGIEFTFVDSHLLRGGEPLGTYWEKFPQLAEMFSRSKSLFQPPEEERSEYEHYLIDSDVTVFARDPKTTTKVWSGDVGYPGNPAYLEFHKQLYPGRLKYWRISDDKANLGAKQPYDPWAAHELISAHAEDFVSLVKSTLAEYKGSHGREGAVVAMYDTELFGHWWWEGPEFLYEMAVRMDADAEVNSVSGSDVVEIEPARHAIHLPEGSWGEGGYHSVWLNEDNVWTWEKLHPCQVEFVELCRSIKSEEGRSILEQAARELLLAEASDWQFLISTFSARDYAEARIQDHLDRYIKLAKMAQKVDSGLELEASEKMFLTECQEKDSPFPYLNLDFWSKLDFPMVPPSQ